MNGHILRIGIPLEKRASQPLPHLDFLTWVPEEDDCDEALERALLISRVIVEACASQRIGRG